MQGIVRRGLTGEPNMGPFKESNRVTKNNFDLQPRAVSMVMIKESSKELSIERITRSHQTPVTI